MIKPLNYHVIIEPDDLDKKSNIAVPKEYQKNAQTGVVIAVDKESDIGLKKGDKVLFNKFKSTSFSVDNKDYVYIKEEEVIGVM